MSCARAVSPVEGRQTNMRSTGTPERLASTVEAELGAAASPRAELQPRAPIIVFREDPEQPKTKLSSRTLIRMAKLFLIGPNNKILPSPGTANGTDRDAAGPVQQNLPIASQIKGDRLQALIDSVKAAEAKRIQETSEKIKQEELQVSAEHSGQSEESSAAGGKLGKAPKTESQADHQVKDLSFSSIFSEEAGKHKKAKKQPKTSEMNGGAAAEDAEAPAKKRKHRDRESTKAKTSEEMEESPKPNTSSQPDKISRKKTKQSKDSNDPSPLTASTEPEAIKTREIKRSRKSKEKENQGETVDCWTPSLQEEPEVPVKKRQKDFTSPKQSRTEETEHGDASEETEKSKKAEKKKTDPQEPADAVSSPKSRKKRKDSEPPLEETPEVSRINKEDHEHKQKPSGIESPSSGAETRKRAKENREEPNPESPTKPRRSARRISEQPANRKSRSISSPVVEPEVVTPRDEKKKKEKPNKVLSPSSESEQTETRLKRGEIPEPNIVPGPEHTDSTTGILTEEKPNDPVEKRQSKTHWKGNQKSKLSPIPANQNDAESLNLSPTRNRDASNGTTNDGILSGFEASSGQKSLKKILRCSFCSRSFRHISAFTLHKRIHTGEKPYRCPTCGKSLSKLSQLRQHKLIHARKPGGPAMQCPLCHKGFHAQAKLVLHLRRHLRDNNGNARKARRNVQDGQTKPGKAMKKCKEVLQRDAESSSRSERPPRPSGLPHAAAPRWSGFLCGRCGRSFPHRYRLWLHQRLHRGNSASFSCARCQLEFRFPRSYAQHLREHTDEAPFACAFCPAGFTERELLDAHVSARHAPRDLTCGVCGKFFSSSKNLRKHGLLHRRARSRKCGRSFSSHVDLAAHVESHRVPTPVSEPLLFPHACGECDSSFSSVERLQVHRACHQGEPETSTASRPDTPPRPSTPPRLPIVNTEHLYRYPHPDHLYCIPVVPTEIPTAVSDSEEEEVCCEQEVNSLDRLVESLVPVEYGCEGEEPVGDRAHTCVMCPASFNDVERLREHYIFHTRRA